jgi:NAD+ synthase
MQTENIINHIVHWLKTYAENAKMKGFVVGISGGIDSAVVSKLCAKTGLKVLLLEMPIRQKEAEVNRAQEHIQQLKSEFSNVEGITVDLTPAFNSFEKTVQQTEELPLEKLALANSRARFRMTTLYFYGQIHHLLVTGTGNKIEDFGVGFFTKYGDGGVDISPIADLTKTQVYEIAKELQIVESIQKAVPTDGLWDVERTDEQQIGATYPELEKIQKEWGTKTEEDYSGRDLEVFKIFKRMNRAAQHKINPIPVCDIPEEWRN